MRGYWIAAGLALVAAGCGDSSGSGGPAAGTLEGDAALIAAAQQISDALGGCATSAGATPTSRVVGLEAASIVMLDCTKTDFSFTSRMFAVRKDGGLSLLTVPDFGANGWFATDQASFPELDAGAGTLTTFRRTGDTDVCGSEGRYAWTGDRFVVEEMRWRACESPNRNGPPYPIIWPTQNAPAIVPDDTTPAP